MIIEKKQCDLCGVLILPETYIKFNGICAKCDKHNKHESFLSERGAPDDRHLVKVKFKLDKKTCKDLFNQDTNQFLLIDMVSRGVNDYYSGEKAKEIVERNFLYHYPMIKKKIKFVDHAEKISRTTELTYFKDIKKSDYSLSKNDPFIKSLGITDKEIQNYEELIVEITEKSIKEFLKDNRDKVFYVFGFDCNAEYGQIQLAMNTEEAFQKSSQMYIEKWNYGKKDLVMLKESSGDWKYQGFNHDYKYWKKCLPFEDKIDKFMFSNSTTSDQAEELSINLMDMFTRALLRVEKSDVFKKIPKEKDFYIQILDHDENPKDSIERIDRIRNEIM